MELLKAIKRMNKLDADMNTLHNWLGHLTMNEKPVVGREWVKLKQAIDGVIDEIAEERNELEEKITKATDGLEIEHK